MAAAGLHGIAYWPGKGGGVGSKNPAWEALVHRVKAAAHTVCRLACTKLAEPNHVELTERKHFRALGKGGNHADWLAPRG